MSKLDEIRKFVDSNPGSRWWVEEYLARGKPSKQEGGEIAGAHVTFGVESTKPNGVVGREIFGPYPVGDMPDGIPLGDMLNELNKAQQLSLETLTSQVASNEGDLKTRQADLDDKVAQLAQVSEDLSKQQTELDFTKVALSEQGNALAAKVREQVTTLAQLTQTTKTLEIRTAEIESLRTTLDGKTTELSGTRDQLITLTDMVTGIKADSAATISQLKAALEAKITEVVTLNGELHKLQSQR